MKWRW